MSSVSLIVREQFVTEALSKAFRHGGEIRLIKSGKGDYLFADDKEASAAAIARCIEAEPPLLEVVRIETVKDKEHRYAVITPAGVELLLSRSSQEEAIDAVKYALGREDERLHALEAAWEQTARANHKAAEEVRRLLDAFAHRITNLAEQIASEVIESRGRYEQLQAKLKDLTKSKASAPSPRPSEEEYGLARQMARHLVFAWQEIADPAAKTTAERALLNAGVKRIGEPGERTKFVGRLHDCDEPAFKDDTVEVERPGWMLLDDKGEFLLAKARVKPSQSEPESTPG